MNPAVAAAVAKSAALMQERDALALKQANADLCAALNDREQKKAAILAAKAEAVKANVAFRNARTPEEREVLLASCREAEANIRVARTLRREADGFVSNMKYKVAMIEKRIYLNSTKQQGVME